MSRFITKKALIDGLWLIQRLPIGDERGYLERMFCKDELAFVIGDRSIVQMNRTLTEKTATIRGMHFQHPPHAEMKLISCLRGEVFDVAVDLRKDSPTFLQWAAEVLTESNHKTFVIPEGFAHGFQALTDNCELLYLHTAKYSHEAEAGLSALDPRLSIRWPLPPADLSVRDSHHALITPNFTGLSL
jgi:dTDP-4-dehydrorhamnose 3,5-epimerase